MDCGHPIAVASVCLDCQKFYCNNKKCAEIHRTHNRSSLKALYQKQAEEAHRLETHYIEEISIIQKFSTQFRENFSKNLDPHTMKKKIEERCKRAYESLLNRYSVIANKSEQLSNHIENELHTPEFTDWNERLNLNLRGLQLTSVLEMLNQGIETLYKQKHSYINKLMMEIERLKHLEKIYQGECEGCIEVIKKWESFTSASLLSHQEILVTEIQDLRKDALSMKEEIRRLINVTLQVHTDIDELKLERHELLISVKSLKKKNTILENNFVSWCKINNNEILNPEIFTEPEAKQIYLEWAKKHLPHSRRKSMYFILTPLLWESVN